MTEGLGPNSEHFLFAESAALVGKDFELIPLMLKGLRDPNVDVNLQALDALRYISRKPNGFGISDEPFEGVGDLRGSVFVLLDGLVALGVGSLVCSHQLLFRF